MIKGILLAGGKGTRLLPATRVTNKHLIPILNKPMVLYPLETLKALGITDILLVSGGDHIGGFAEFLGDGSEFGVNLTYRVQSEAGGIAQALALAEDFSAFNKVVVILGDNIFDSEEISYFRGIIDRDKLQANLFVKQVENPSRFGVLTKKRGKYIIEEKPKTPDSKFAVTGLYAYPASVFEVVKKLKPSKRGELEITDVNNHFIKGNCTATEVKGFWSDAGTPESLLECSKWAANQ